jgi:hypothetical protein
MEKSYRNLAYLSVIIFIVVIIGFYRTYFGLFPKFENVANVVHLHTGALLLWSFLTIAQPILIRTKKIHVHRLLGKISYLLAPIIVYTTLALGRHMFFQRTAHVPMESNLKSLFLPFSHMFLFSLFYGLAIFHKKKAPIHMRYMIAASFVVLAPAIVRIDFSWTGLEFDRLLFSYLFVDLLLAILIIFDEFNKKKYAPYFVALGFFILVHVSTFYVSQTPLWQIPAAKIVEIFF